MQPSTFNRYLQLMLVKTFGSAVYGVEAITITIEVNWMTIPVKIR